MKTTGTATISPIGVEVKYEKEHGSVTVTHFKGGDTWYPVNLSDLTWAERAAAWLEEQGGY